MTLNAKLGRNGGFECPTKLVARNVMLRKTTLNIVNEKTRWLWTPSWKGIMALNTKTGEMTLNAQRGWTTALNAEWKTNNGSERRNWETMVALNAKTGEMALNAQRGWTTALNAEWKTNNGFECRNWETMVALNVKTGEVALNAELKCDMMALNDIDSGWMVALNAKLQGNDEGEIRSSVARCDNP